MQPAARTPLITPLSAAMLTAGALAALLLPRVVPWPIALVLLGGAVAAIAVGRGRPALAAALLGFGLASLHAAYALAIQLPADLERAELAVTGRIVDLPMVEPRRTRFTLQVDADAEAGPLRGRTVRLSWYDHGRRSARPVIRAGERWTFRVRVRAPRGLRNPGGADAEKHALAQRVSATGYVHVPSAARQLDPASGVGAWRERMSERIDDAVPDASARFVRALALGDTRGLDEADWHVLRANGLTHLIAISGFHVGLVAGFFALLARGLARLGPALVRRWPTPVLAAASAVVGAGMYAAAAGFSLPTVRTLLMIGAVAGARMVRRSAPVVQSLALATVAVVLVDPLALLQAGFWLSFAGVAWLVWCLPGTAERGPRAWVAGFVSAQGVATVGLLPLCVAFFGQASLAGPFANLLAVPWWSLVVVPLALIGLALESLFAGAGAYAWRLAAAAFDLSWPLFDALAASPLALWWLPEASAVAVPLALAGAVWLLLPRGLPGRGLALLLWLPLLWPDRRFPADGEVEVVALDVGQGLAVVVRTARHTLLYDMGPAVPDGFDAGERAVVPALHALGISRLDRAIVSHADSDHAGGFDAVRRAIPIARAYAPEGSGMDGTLPCVAGQAWQWDGVVFRTLHPTPHFPYLGNEAGCVLRIETRHGAALLTGDIGHVIERGLVRRAASYVRADVVFVGHHGSAGSSDPAFVAATGARHALVSSGHGNRFGHPKPAVVERWRDAGARVHDTAVGGALRVSIERAGIEIETRRHAQPRLWDAVARSKPPEAGVSYGP
ncbi:DNA internalization-related competence protein ComEC/Rec2 [Cognatilysobacter bugurensis]|uniref:DNA internalization-related competence protein ComEC/Rec2 n=1 Tax=Cognatilysobacter bugurensis TaxID=543356 RepID=A0A918SU37_9GAMM|nr:DNA internalization-related competence protein ComEC/Rec2 [Lysobacter bugurensis]GHA70791.1 DNA internalization-related competence protein ComEC/Rec2 [Lysobacter bugurensis]